MNRGATILLGAALASPGVMPLPVEFHHDRIILVATATDGSTLRLYTDTGGGWDAIRSSVADRLDLAPVDSIESGEGMKVPLVDYPSFLIKAGVPTPTLNDWLEGRLVVVPDKRLSRDTFLDRPWCDGVLGSAWFADRVWEFDYPGKTLKVLSEWSPSLNASSTPLGFRLRPDGKREYHFPRITVSIAGQPFEMLLDTGATAELTTESAPVFGGKAGDLAGISYITESSLEGWREHHPDWRVLARAEAITGRERPMIEVPEVVIAGIPVGPVWFAQQPDHAFREIMSEGMDRPIEGAIGGSALKYFHFVLDYPRATAYFDLPGTPASQSR
jgi:hypothetical protein